jgi:hypothetical protein
MKIIILKKELKEFKEVLRERFWNCKKQKFEIMKK